MAESNRKRDFEEALKHCEALASSLKPPKQKKPVEYVFLRDPVGERQTHCKYRPTPRASKKTKTSTISDSTEQVTLQGK